MKTAKTETNKADPKPRQAKEAKLTTVFHLFSECNDCFFFANIVVGAVFLLLYTARYVTSNATDWRP